MSGRHYHWLSHRLPDQDLHHLCAPGCNDFFRFLPLHLTHQIITYLDPVSIVRASRERRLAMSMSHV